MTRRKLLLSAMAAASVPAFGQESVALRLAGVLNRIGFGGLSAQAVKHAKIILASTLASAAAGWKIDSVRMIRELARGDSGNRNAAVWFDAAMLPLAEAARINAMASDASASDDSDLRNVAHIGTCVTAVGLALGESAGASGQDLLAAIVAGYEAAGRIGEAMLASSGLPQAAGAISGSVGRGFHASSIVAFGGTAAAAKLLRLSDDRLANALGITATTVGGLSISTNSWAREYHAGNAALTAVNAALAAGQGYKVNPDMIEARGGFLNIFAGGRPDTTSLERELAGDYQISRYLAIKLVPGAHALHCAVEAAVNAAKAMPGPSEDVAKILVAGPQSELASSRHAPKDVIEAIHSLSYYLASAVADRDFSWIHADPKMIQRPLIARLIGLVEQDPKPSPIRYEWNWGATVTLVTKSGERYTSTVDAPRGSAPRGIEWGDIDAKYHALTPQSGLPASRLEQALNLIHDFEGVKSTATFARLLSSGAGSRPAKRL